MPSGVRADWFKSDETLDRDDVPVPVPVDDVPVDDVPVEAVVVGEDVTSCGTTMSVTVPSVEFSMRRRMDVKVRSKVTFVSPN